ncbi:hypothetical protein [Arthrobacter sp. K5]|jgi:hypothetical protein|uniref:Uncharacterized protein n=1 Tax=Arthrobacter sp. K5 TaxID=2839623 RepID=A0AAU8EN84_9MICC
MKKLFILFALLIGLIAGGVPATAAPAAKEPNPFAPALNEGTFYLNGFCSFKVKATLTGKIKVIELPGDRTTTISPGAKITLTNVKTGTTVSYVITGVIHEQVLVDENGTKFRDVQATGNNLLLIPDPDSGLSLVTGNFHYTLNLDGSERTRFEVTDPGQVIDVCDALG